jgi:hypothetical protein
MPGRVHEQVVMPAQAAIHMFASLCTCTLPEGLNQLSVHKFKQFNNLPQKVDKNVIMKLGEIHDTNDR